MKNSIAILAILLSGIINAQSFTTVKEVKHLDSTKLEALGFSKVSDQDSIYFKLYDHNENAIKYINNTTGEIVKMSTNSIEYIYSSDVEIEKKRVVENISYSLLSSIGAGWNKNPLTKIHTLNNSEIEISSSATIYSKLNTVCLHRFLIASDSSVSFVVFF